MGLYISAGVLVFMYRYLRPLFEAGKVYKVYSPLYKLDDKDTPFIANKSEKVKLHHKNIAKVYKVKIKDNKSYFTKDQFRQFLEDVYDYDHTISRAAASSGKLDKIFVEWVVGNLVSLGFVKWHADEFDFKSGHFTMKDDDIFNDQKFITKFMSIIQKKYPEVKITENGVLYGIVNKSKISLDICRRLFIKAEAVIPIITKYGFIFDVLTKSTDRVQTMTLCEFMDKCTPLVPKIKHRYKGLSELEADDLRHLVMDINNRVSVQFTVDDVEKEIEIFKMTHGVGTEDMLRRKKLMKEYRVSRDDLDN